MPGRLAMLDTIEEASDPGSEDSEGLGRYFEETPP